MIVSMLVCAAFGYALGIFPVWFHALKLHETETLGRVVMISESDPFCAASTLLARHG